MAETLKTPRPENRNLGLGRILMAYRLPLAGRVSILHRISGALLFVFLPLVLYLFERSLTSELSFDALRSIASNWFVKLVILALAWGYLHHFSAGIRHLFMDAHLGLTKDGSRQTAASVLIVSLVLTALVALKLFGAF